MGLRGIALVALLAYCSTTGFCKQLTGKYGCLASPSFPQKYGNSQDTTDEIIVAVGQQIRLEFHQFDVEKADSCRYDYLEITDGGVAKPKYCGQAIPAVYTSSSNRLTLKFHSDHSVVGLGFFAAYRVTNATIAPNPAVNGGWCSFGNWSTCSASCGNGTQTAYRACSCPAPSGNGSYCVGAANTSRGCSNGDCFVPTTAPSGCVPQMFSSNNGTFSSPQYPYNYPHNAACTYNITVDDNKSIKILFDAFTLEDGATTCIYDKLEIYEGSVKAATFCGDGPVSKIFTSQGNKLFLRFTSDGSVTQSGFHAVFSAVAKEIGGGAKVNNPKCGITTIKQSRVIGGKDAVKGAWPWQIGMYKDGLFICGGSLISPNWVLTASHCIDAGGKADQANGYSIIIGDLNRNANDTTEQQHMVSKIIMHPKYDGSTLNNDIALLKLSSPVIMNDHVNTVCLPNKTDPISVGSRCYITGWGKIQHPGNSHPQLQQAVLPVINSTTCQKKLDNTTFSLKITDKMFCAGEPGTVKSGCHGDSGGPYVCPDQNGRYLLHGDVSWGSPRCDTAEMFTVFGRVTEFREWVDQTLATL